MNRILLSLILILLVGCARNESYLPGKWRDEREGVHSFNADSSIMKATIDGELHELNLEWFNDSTLNLIFPYKDWPNDLYESTHYVIKRFKRDSAVITQVTGGKPIDAWYLKRIK